MSPDNAPMQSMNLSSHVVTDMKLKEGLSQSQMDKKAGFKSKFESSIQLQG